MECKEWMNMNRHDKIYNVFKITGIKKHSLGHLLHFFYIQRETKR